MPDQEHVVRGPKVDYQLPDVPLGEHLLRCLRKHGNKPAQRFIDDNQVFTFSQLAERGCSIATELRARGIGEGDIVSISTKVCPEFIQIMLGTFFVGATLAPLNYKFDEHDFNLLLTLLEPRIVFSTPESADRIKKVLLNLNLSTELVVLEENSLNWQKFITHKPDPDFQPARPADWLNKEVLIMCSSGTTGLPKGVMITNKGLMIQAAMLEDGNDFIEKEDRILLFSSPFWISGPLFYLVGLYMGLELLLGVQFEPELFLKTVHNHKTTSAFLSPNQSIAVAKCPAVGKYDLSSMRLLVCSGAAMNREAQLLVEQSLKMNVMQGYAMTEALIVLRLSPKDSIKEGSTGKPTANMELKIVNIETGLPAGANCEGEVLIRGPTLTKGYYRNPEATAATIDKDGWLHTGDIGYYDEEGYFFIIDRIKDLIKYKGNHVAPIEIESPLLEHPGVKDVAVVGVKHELDQEHPMAVVIRQPGSQVTEEELVQLVKNNLAEHKWLRGGVRFVDELPKTPTGKIQRRKVRMLIEADNREKA